MRFKYLREGVAGISPKVLAKELQEPKQHQFGTRTVTKPVIEALLEFGTD